MSEILTNFASRTFTRGHVTIKLPRKRFLIVAALLAARGSPVATRDLFELLYGDDADGGPLSADNVIGPFIHILRYGRPSRYPRDPPLQKLGLAIVCDRRGAGRRPGYRIVHPVGWLEAAE